MKVTVDQSICTGCEVCAEIAPDVFEMTDDMLSAVKNPGADLPADQEELVREAADSCPVDCIEVEE